ncbi:hypothetical protein Hypma_001542 [Hypsizygus marmoreus]|uniref:Uncharacterized protein n=1 Tax=Hypsizygus marmoreus TaxID=39966 RepID=A0A369K0E6_HYPMA|nr:hypothetical protein Hypma_001542 [Hypsizygus marmoreus]
MTTPEHATLGPEGLNLVFCPVNEWEQPGNNEIVDDLNREQETLLLDDMPATKSHAQFSTLADTIASAFKRVTDKTNREYCR